MDFSTPDWEFSLDDTPEVKLGSDPVALPFLSDPEAWKQYNNNDIYEADKLMREWLAVMKTNKKWCRTQNMRKYTFAMLFEQLKGRKYDVKKDCRITNAYAKVFTWYSTRVLKKGTSIYGKTYTKPVYVVSPKRLDQYPYSLKLRLEFLSEQGIIPTTRNMKLPKDMPQGTARNPKTAANMERRQRLAKDRYNERYKDRAH